jgi:hypothetical protein
MYALDADLNQSMQHSRCLCSVLWVALTHCDHRCKRTSPLLSIFASSDNPKILAKLL